MVPAAGDSGDGGVRPSGLTPSATAAMAPAVACIREQLAAALAALAAELAALRVSLRKPALEWLHLRSGVSGLQEYLVELPRAEVDGERPPVRVPATWVEVCATKATRRYRTPATAAALSAHDVARELLTAAHAGAWRSWLATRLAPAVASDLRSAVDACAHLQALFVLAAAACAPGMVRPRVLGTDVPPLLHILDGRHAGLDAHLQTSSGAGGGGGGGGGGAAAAAAVPTCVHVGPWPKGVDGEAMTCCHAAEGSGDEPAVVVLTGPNAGGKSTAVRMAVQAVLLAHIGSWVPARAAVMSVLHAVHTRMGAGDDLLAGLSTFGVEMTQAAGALSALATTPRALAVFDELGRGTSTHDGAALAVATLRHVARLAPASPPLAIFITHYNELVAAAEAVVAPAMRLLAANWHMAFLVGAPGDSGGGDDDGRLTFLYRLARGAAPRSYGLQVAAACGLPRAVLRMASATVDRLTGTTGTGKQEQITSTT